MLRLDDFQAMWLPKDIYYKNLLMGRSPLRFSPQDRMSAFTSLTASKIQQALQLYVDCERQAESLRRSLNAKTWVNLLDVFRAVDKNADGYITTEEFGDILRDSELTLT